MADTLEINPYLRTKILTASPEELRLMLIEGAIRFSRQGREAMVKKDFEGVYENMTKAKEILLELMNALRHDIEPEICANLERLYTYMYRRMLDAGMEKNPEIVDEVIDLLEYDRETWMMLMKQVADERKGGAAGRTDAPAPGRFATTGAGAASPDHGERPGGFSVEG